MSYLPFYRISPALLNQLTRATELRQWIANATVDVSWLPALQKDTAARLAHSSTAIEGNPLSLKEVRLLSRGDSVRAQDKSRKEVLDYLNALAWIENQPAASGMTEKKLLFLHEKLTQQTLATGQSGCYKSRPNRIVDGRGYTVYTPPPPKVVKKLTRELLEWINETLEEKSHPLIVSSIAHHRLVSIHPFMDGNGRISRVLAIWVLYTRGFDSRHLFALDEYFETDRHRYYDKIQQVRELDQDLTGWLEYTAEGLVDALEKTRQRIESLQIQSRDSRLVLTRRQEELLRFIRERGKVGSLEICRAFQLTRSRVNQIVKPLVVASILSREGSTRATVYKIT